MIKEEVAPGIVIYSNVLSDMENLSKDIEDGIEAAKLEWRDAYVKNNSGVSVDKKIRDVKSISIDKVQSGVMNPIKESFYNNLFEIFQKGFSLIENDYRIMYGMETEWHDNYQILKYGEGQHFSNHVDDNLAYHRRISTLYYLNDDYSGGEINFPRFQLSIKPLKNQMILFPSTYVYNHYVSPVKEGTRYAVVSWLR
jgi:Rps23 Pro-64 3,4-dihydroxylase Tpa1-like proline 4-hydroxylase